MHRSRKKNKRKREKQNEDKKAGNRRKTEHEKAV